MKQIPRERALDSTAALLSEGYAFISNRCRRFGSDTFLTRIMLTPAVCTLGEEAARLLYDGARFTRKEALPIPMLTLLLDKGSVEMLDDEPHRHRKRMFMSLMTPGGMRRLVAIMAELWRNEVSRWEGLDEIVLHREAQQILCRAACAWTGVPLADAEARRRTREFAAMVDGAGSVGPRNWRGQLLRARTEEWARGIIRRIRSGELRVAEGSAAEVVALHRNLDGELLDSQVAAVELINLLRPTVAVSRFITFAALALFDHAEAQPRLREGDEQYLEWFVQEVRRFYPFFPFVAGRARGEVEWRGDSFAPGSWFFLDLYGTNHDPRIWGDPQVFRPERFREWNGSPFGLVPQGGGDFLTSHRCAGEWITIELVKEGVRLLSRAMRYEVPPQDLRVPLGRMPAIPNSRFRIRSVERA